MFYVKRFTLISTVLNRGSEIRHTAMPQLCVNLSVSEPMIVVEVHKAISTGKCLGTNARFIETTGIALLKRSLHVSIQRKLQK